MATTSLVRGKTLPNSGTKNDLHELIDLSTVSISDIVNADISASAAIAGTKVNPNFGGQDIICDDVTAGGDMSVNGTLIVSGAVSFGSTLSVGGLSPFLDNIKDYGTSSSVSTAKNQEDLNVCYGITGLISASSSQAITNLPFTDSTSYKVTCVDSANGNGLTSVAYNSGAQFTITNGSTDTSQSVSWIAMGV